MSTLTPTYAAEDTAPSPAAVSPAVASSPSAGPPSAHAVPQWAIAIVVLVLSLLGISAAFYFLRRRMRRKSAIDIADRMEKRSSLASFRTIVASKKASSKEKAPLPNLQSPSPPPAAYPVFHEKNGHESPSKGPVSHASEEEEPQMSRHDELRISLPLPPASTSLFSDKMELNSDEARELFEMYMSAQADKNAFVSIDLDDKPTFYSSAAANIQKKTATIRSTLRQSLRRKPTKGAVPISEVFQSVNKPKDEEAVPPEPRQRKTSNGSSRLPRPALPHSPSPPPTPDKKTVMDHSQFSTVSLGEETSKIAVTPLTSEDTTSSKKGTDRSEPVGPASRRLSRNVSRKARVQSMIVTDEALPVRSELEPEPVPSPAPSSENAQAERRKLFEDSSDEPARPVAASRSETTNSEVTAKAPRRKSYTPHTIGRFSGSATISGKSSAAESFAQAGNPFADRHESKQRANTMGRSAVPPKGATSVRGSKQLHSLFDSESIKSQVPSPTSTGGRSMLSELAGVLSKDAEMDKRLSHASITSDRPPLTGSGNVDTIRRVLQSTWTNNLKESDSMMSFMSSSDTAESLRQGISPPGSVNPRQLNQHLVSLSLKAQQARRPEMPAGFMPGDDLMGPEPTASFSSSTVRTMIPADEASKLNTTKDTQVHKQTHLESKVSVSTTSAEPQMEEGRSTTNNKGAFGTLRGNRRQQARGSIPWAEGAKANEKTPAQRERDRYLRTLKG